MHRLIIRCRISIEDGAELGLSLTRPMRAFLHLRDRDGYLPTPEVVGNDQLYGQLLVQAYADMQRLSERIRQIEALRPGATVPVQEPVNTLERWIARQQQKPDSGPSARMSG